MNPLKALRIATGLSQDEVGERVGVLQGAISKIETGHRLPSLRMLANISDALMLTDAQAGKLARALVAESGSLKAESGITVLVAIADVVRLTDDQAGRMVRSLINTKKRTQEKT